MDTMLDRLMTDVRREAAQVRDLAQRQRAQSLSYALQGHIESTIFKMLDLPPVYGTLGEDGSFIIEWMFENKRLGFSIEPHDQDSSWFMVAKDGTGDSGLLINGGMDKLVERFLALDGSRNDD